MGGVRRVRGGGGAPALQIAATHTDRTNENFAVAGFTDGNNTAHFGPVDVFRNTNRLDSIYEKPSPDSIRVLTAGEYLIQFWASFRYQANARITEFPTVRTFIQRGRNRFFATGAWGRDNRPQDAAGTFSITLSSITHLLAGDEIALGICSDTAGTNGGRFSGPGNPTRGIWLAPYYTPAWSYVVKVS